MDVNEMKAGYAYGDYLSDIGNVSQEVRHGMWAITPRTVDDEMSEEFAGGGGNKYTRYDDVSGDDFPTHNNINTSPSIRNDLDANSALYNEDLEYKHVDDATQDEYVLTENIQKMDKEFVKTGHFTEEDRENVLSITRGDSYTYDVAKVYDFLMSISNPNMNRLDNEKYKMYVKRPLFEIYLELVNYDKNVFPIVDKENLHGIELYSALKKRSDYINYLKTIPSQYLRNLRADIRKPRTTYEFELNNVGEYFQTIQTQMKNISRLSDDKQQKILSKVFSNKNDTFEKVAQQMEKLDVLFLHHDDGVEELKQKIEYESDDGEAFLIYEKDDVLVVDVKSSDAMKSLGCGSQWCFATEYDRQHWKDYSHNRNVNIVYNFNKNPESRKRMVVVLPNGEIYDMYNEYMNDGDEYLGKLGVTQHLNAGATPNLEYAEEYDEELNERKKAWIPGSQAVEVKRECQLGGKGDGTSKACNQGDINNLVLTTIKEYFSELNEYSGEKHDKYVSDRIGEPTEFEDFEKQYQKHIGDLKQLRKPIQTPKYERGQKVKDKMGNTTFDYIPVYVNPDSLGAMDSDVRAILLDNGNLYVAEKQVEHTQIVMALIKNRIVDLMTPQDADKYPEKFINLIRRGNTNVLELSSSQGIKDVDANYIESIFEKARKNVGTGIIFKTSVSINEKNTIFAEEKSPENMSKLLEQISNLQELPFRDDVENLGGQIYSVGGAVRDEFLGKESKDLDVLITGVPVDELENILSNYGKVDAVGKSFGVLKFRPEGSNEEIDVTIPRTETATGEGGHKGFDVISDHELPIEKDLYRRDFTINAIAKDIDGNVVDPYNGREDLENKIIRVVNPDAFSEDPLRMLRAVQFASRFGFTIEPETMNLIKENASRIKEIPAERILIEFDKIVQKGNKEIGAELLVETGLYENIFGVRAKEFPNLFEKIQTMGEFIFTICKGVLNDCADFYKNTLKGEIDTYKEIKALQLAYENPDALPITVRSITHNMYLISPNSLNSGILPNNIEVSANELLSGKYPKTVNELAVTGNDLIELGLQGKEIGDMQKILLLKIYNDKVENNKENLLTLANEIMSNELSEVRVLDNNNNVDNNKRRDEKPIQYSAVILEESSRQRLLRAIKMMGIEIPDDWEIIAHHVTIAFGQKIPDEFTRMNTYLGGKVDFMAETVAMDENVIAVGVSGVESLNEIPHITVAVNRPAGAKPVMSNDLTDWKPLKRPLRLIGKVEEVEFKG